MAVAVLAMALAAACMPSDGLDYVCGPRAAEDVVRVPDTPWLITSGLATDRPGQLWLVDVRSHRAQPAHVVSAATTDWREHCPAPPQFDRLSMDGLGLRAGQHGRHQLFVANHGDRHAIEVFDIQVRPHGVPLVRWTGCIPAPPHTLVNAVVPLRDGGLVMASFHDPDDAQVWDRLARGEPVGSVWEWHPDRGWRELPAGPLAGANGLALSDDERTVIVSAWAASRLVVFDREGRAPRREIPLDFMPDNLSREPDGTLIVAGQRARVADVAACTGPVCPLPWVVARIDARSGERTTLAQGRGTPEIGYACGALRVGDTLYITARGDDRLAWVRLRH